MHLVLSTESVRNAVFTHETGQVLYKTTHPQLKVGMGTTTIYKIKPNDDPMDMRDRFAVVGEIEWHLIGSSTFRLYGRRDMQSNAFLPSHGLWGRKRTFTGPDGCPYRWDMLFDAVVLSRDDGSRTEVARYHRGSLGLVGPRRKPRLEIDPDVEHMLDLIVLTFVYVEKIRMDKDRESGRYRFGLIASIECRLISSTFRVSLPLLSALFLPFLLPGAMRALPDPLTCSTGSLSPSLDVPKALIRSDIWFRDGNIVLVAGSAAFKVHRGQLERHSEVFKDMFLVGRAGVGPLGQDQCDEDTTNEEGNKTVDGCPTVDIYDCPSDVYHLLVALYDGFYFPQIHARDFSALSSVLRLSTKYFIDHLRAQCLARLFHDWPTSLADWDKREAAATDAGGRYTPRDAYAHPVLVINLALELNIPELLPSAFYDLSRYGPSRILAGARAPPPVFAAPDPCASRAIDSGDGRAQPLREGSKPPMIHLSQDSLVRTLRGRELAQLYISTFLTRALEHRPSAACLYATRASASAGGPSGSSASTSPAPRSTHCTESFYFIHLNVLRSVGGIACGRDADPLYTLVQAAEMVERKDFSDGVRTCGLKMCGVCKREWKGEVGRAREEVWKLIPVWFGLREGGAAECTVAPTREPEDVDVVVEELGDADVDLDELEE